MSTYVSIKKHWP